ncbi:MAG: hypothetical protein L3J86_04660, partial [Thermoplasmata archaeon]|nr:hypothetical protein [Thermoplasmata archaeon]
STASAPNERVAAAFASLRVVTATVAPSDFATCTAAEATPPPAPMIATVEPGRVSPMVRIARHAVWKTSGTAAA